MALSPEQHEHLLDLIKWKEPNWRVSNYLTLECGLSFREASNLRHQINEEKNRRLADTKSEEDRRETPPSPIDSEETFEALGLDEIETPSPPASPQKETECITCHSKDFSCECPVKYVKEIPF